MVYARDTLELHSTVSDLIPADAPLTAWNSTRNVIFRNNENLRVPGDTPTLTGNTDAIVAMVYVERLGTGFRVLANTTSVKLSDGSTYWDITPPGWATAGPYSIYTSAVCNGLAVLNCSEVGPFYWDGDTNNVMKPLPGWPSGRKCNAIRAHKNFLFAIGMTDTGGNEVLWSDAAGPGEIPQTWAPAPDNLAGSVVLAPLFEPCMDALSMRDEFLIYKRQAIWAASFVGGQFVFAFREVFGEHGLAATNALTRGPDDQHLFVAAVGDVYITDGNQVRSVLDARAQRAFYADFTSEPNPVLAAVSLQREKLGVVIYPQQGSTTATQALLYDFVSGDIGFRDMPSVLCAESGRLLSEIGDRNRWDGADGDWDPSTTAWDETLSVQSNDDVLVGTVSGVFCISDPTGNDFATGPVQTRLSKLGLSFGSTQDRKQVKALWPKVTGRTGDTLTFRVTAQEHATGPVTLSEPLTYTIGQSDPLDVFLTGRYFGMEVTSLGGAPWRMGTIDVEYRGVGRW